jgi:hypothetical protein
MVFEHSEREGMGLARTLLYFTGATYARSAYSIITLLTMIREVEWQRGQMKTFYR